MFQQKCSRRSTHRPILLQKFSLTMVAVKRKSNGDAARAPKKAKLPTSGSKDAVGAHAKSSRHESSGVKANVPESNSTGSDLSEDEIDNDDGEARESQKNVSLATADKGVNGGTTQNSANGRLVQCKRPRSYLTFLSQVILLESPTQSRRLWLSNGKQPNPMPTLLPAQRKYGNDFD